MKISEARKLYHEQITDYQEQRGVLSKRKQELEKRMDTDAENKTVYENEAAILELTIKDVDEKLDEYKEYMGKLTRQQMAEEMAISSKQQGEAAKDYVENLGKIMEVARRLSKGDIVPATDEKKLMDYNAKMYQIAKNAGAMKQVEKRKKHGSLWDDEEEKPKEMEDPVEAAGQKEAFAKGPEITEVEAAEA